MKRGLYLSAPDSFEQAFEIANAVVLSGKAILVVIDSVSALAPRAVLECEVGDAHPGLHERILRQALSMLVGRASVSGTAVVLTNDLTRDFPEVDSVNWQPLMAARSSAKYFCSVRIWLERVALLDTEDVVGDYVSALVVKNRLAAPFKVAMFGVLHSGQIIDNSRAARLERHWLDPDYEKRPLHRILLERYELSQRSMEDTSRFQPRF